MVARSAGYFKVELPEYVYHCETLPDNYSKSSRYDSAFLSSKVVETFNVKVKSELANMHEDRKGCISCCCAANLSPENVY